MTMSKTTTTRRKRSVRTPANEQTVIEYKIDLKSSLTKVDAPSFMKMMMYGSTGCGTTWGALNILRSEHFKGDLIYINTDMSQNLYDNVKILTDEEQERLIIPKKEDGSYYRVIEPELWEAIWKQLEETYGDFSSVAGIVVDYIELLYDGYINRADPQTPFAYGKPRKDFLKAVWNPLLRTKTNVIFIGKEYPVFVDTGKGDQFKEATGQYVSWLDGSKSLEKWKVDLNMIVCRDMKYRGDKLRRTWTTIFEKHKLGLDAFELKGDDSNLFNVLYNYYLEQQIEIKGS